MGLKRKIFLSAELEAVPAGPARDYGFGQKHDYGLWT